MHQLGVSLEDLYNGVTRKLALQKNVICGKCEGKISSGLKHLLLYDSFKERSGRWNKVDFISVFLEYFCVLGSLHCFMPVLIQE